MTTPVDVDLGLDASGYAAGAQQVAQSSTNAALALSGLATAHRAVTSVLGAGLPGKIAFAGFIAAAADAQEMYSGLRAQQVLTGQSSKALEESTKSLARAFPVGQAGALQLVRTLQTMGLSGAGQEKQVAALARGFIQLGGATGESASGLGGLQVQLSKLYGNLDPSRVSKMNDSLVTVSASAGASATSVLTFANAIGPLARAAGIGQTAVMGIAAQMASLGQSGASGATALNKVFADLNQSVVDGSGQLATYARIVGMTATQFKALYQNNPTQAIERVTGALAQPGGQGQRNLQQLGFGDSIRTQVALQALSQSGGLSTAINAAVAGYGNGKTAQASKAAFDNLEDDLGKLGTSAQILAETLGGPFLKAASLATAAFTDVLKPLQAIAGSKVGQGVLSAAAYALPIGALALGGGKLLAEGGLLSQLFTSGTLAAGRYGRALGRAGIDETASIEAQRAAINQYVPGRLRRRGALRLAEQRAAAGEFTGVTGRASQAMFAAQMGYATPATAAQAATAGMTMRQRMSGAVGTGIRAYGSMISTPMYMATLDPAMRARVSLSSGIPDSALTEDELAHRRAISVLPGAAGAQARQTMGAGLRGVGAGLRTGDAAALRGGFSQIGSGASGAIAASGGALRSSAAAAGQVARAGGRFAAQGAMSIGGGLAGFAAANPIGLGITAATIFGPMLYDRFKHRNDERNAAIDDIAHGDIYKSMNAYADALGQAGTATRSFAQIANDSAQALQKQQGSSVSSAKSVTSADVQAGVAEDLKTVQGRLPAGLTGNEDAATIAQRINSTSVGGISSQVAQQQKLDLLRLTGGDQVKTQDVLNRLNITDAANPNVPQARSFNDIYAGFYGTLAGESHYYGPGASATGQVDADPNKRPDSKQIIGILGNRMQKAGSDAPQFTDFSDADKGAYSDALKAIGQNYDINQQAYGSDYATQQRLQEVSQLYSNTSGAIGGGLSGGDKDLILNQAAKAIDPAFKGHVTDADLKKANGNLAIAMGYADPSYKSGILDPLTAKGGSATSGGLQPTFQPDTTTMALAKTGSPLAQYFTNNPFANAVTGSTQNAVSTAVSQPADTTAQVKATEALVNSAHAMGMSFNDVITSASKMASQLDSNSAQLALLQQVLQTEQTLGAPVAVGNGFLAQQQFLGSQIQGEQTLADKALPGSPDASKALQQANELRAQQYQGEQQALASSLQTYRNYGIQVARSQEDFQLQEGRSAEDFNEQRQRGQQDFYTQQLYANEDFNKQLSRQIEDAAKTLYDPYQRILAKPVFDAGTLLANLKNQAQAMAQQLANLATARKMGLSDQAIQQLSLSSTDQAQQLAELVDNAKVDPSVIAQLNQATKQRSGLSGQLVTDKGNTDYQRELADFNTATARQTAQYNLSVSRSEADFAKQTARSQADFHKSLVRMHEDLVNQDTQIIGDVTTLADQLQKAVSGQAVNWASVTASGMQQQLQTFQQYAQQFQQTASGFFGSSDGSSGGSILDTVKGGLAKLGSTLLAGLGITGSNAKSVSDPNVARWSDDIKKAAGMLGLDPTDQLVAGVENLIYHESGGNPNSINLTDSNAKAGHPSKGLMQTIDGTFEEYRSKSLPDNVYDPLANIYAGMAYALRNYGLPMLLAGGRHNAQGGYIGYATGGVAMKPHVGMVAEAGHPELMTPLNASGVQFVAQAFSRALSMDDVRAMMTASVRAMPMPHVGGGSVTSNDYTQSFAGASITVMASDPGSLGDALARRQRTDALTAGRR